MIIVTGGAGFIGSNLVKELNRQGESNILIVDNLYKSKKHLNLNRLKFIDFVDKQKFIENLNIFPIADYIFHQGACSDTTEKNGHYMMKNNYEYSKDLLNYSIKNKIPFIYASSAAVYGNGTYGFSEHPSTEYPLNIYGFSKLCFDNYVRRQIKNTSSQILGLRYFNVYGPQENHKGRMASVALHLYQQIKKGKSMELFHGSNKFFRDFIYVNDTIKINMFFLKKGVSGIFNAGTGKINSFYKISELLSSHKDSANVKFIDFPVDLKENYQQYTKADIANLIKVGYEAKFLSLEEGIKNYISILDQSNGYYL